MGFGVSSADTSSKTTEMKSGTDESGRYGKSVLIRWEDPVAKCPGFLDASEKGRRRKKVCGGGVGGGGRDRKRRGGGGGGTRKIHRLKLTIWHWITRRENPAVSCPAVRHRRQWPQGSDWRVSISVTLPSPASSPSHPFATSRLASSGLLYGLWVCYRLDR